MSLGTAAGNVGRGLTAGLAGTAAITVSLLVESKIRGREPSTTPADAGGEVLGVTPKGDTEAQRFSNVMHWAYGTGWGAVRGALGSVGLPTWAATGAHFAAVQGTAMAMLPALHVAPPVKEWGAPEVASEAMHHVVYALVAGAAFDYLVRHAAR